MRVLVSSCLLGIPCRYDGKSAPLEGLAELASKVELVPVCPEQMGGLATPRPPAERVGDKVLTKEGGDVTEQYRRGAAIAAALAELTDCDCALLKAKSPSCGDGLIYDGTFTGTKVAGNGVTAEAVKALGLPVFDETRWDEFLAFIGKEASK